jgi:predicted TPR repeat methyltransferase
VVLALLGGLATLIVGAVSPTPEVPVASVSEALQAFEGAADDLPPEQAVIVHLSHAELLEVAGDRAAARATYAEVVALDPGGPLGAQARRVLTER